MRSKKGRGTNEDAANFLGMIILASLLVPEGGGAFIATFIQRVCIAAAVTVQGV